MNYDFTPEQLSIKDNFTKFCSKEIEPRAAMQIVGSQGYVTDHIFLPYGPDRLERNKNIETCKPNLV